MSELFQNLVTDKVEIEKYPEDAGNVLQKIVRAGLKRVLGLANLLPATYVESLLLFVLNRGGDRYEGKEWLGVLLRLDNHLYAMQTKASISYGDGKHTKHRHLDYHSFFVNRISANERVLDIGCGHGAVAYSVATKTGAAVVGVDFEASSIALAREWHQHETLEFREGDALELQDEAFDVVVLSNVLEHIAYRDEFLKRVQAVTGVQRFLIRVPVFERDWRVPLKAELGVEWRLDPTHETEFTLETFEEETRAGGLKIVYLESRWGEIWAELAPIDA